MKILSTIWRKIVHLQDKEHQTTEALSGIAGKSISRTKNYLQAMAELDYIVAEGGNRNRTYSLIKPVKVCKEI